MAATVHFDESNGAVETVDEATAHTHYGRTDAPELDDTLPAEAIPVPGASMEKWQRVHLTDLGGSSSVLGLRFFTENAPAPSTEHRFNGSPVQATYDTIKKTLYQQPLLTTTKATQLVPQADPAVAHIGIGGSLTGALTAPGRSDYIVSQIRTLAGAISGQDLVVGYGYDETA